MTNSPRLDSAPGYVAMRLDGTLLLVDTLAVRDIRSEADATSGAGCATLKRGDREVAIVPLAGSLRALAEGRRPQMVVLGDDHGELALACDEITVFPAGSVSIEPLRGCMTSPDSPLLGLARAAGKPAFLCSAKRLAASARRLWEQTHG